MDADFDDIASEMVDLGSVANDAVLKASEYSIGQWS